MTCGIVDIWTLVFLLGGDPDLYLGPHTGHAGIRQPVFLSVQDLQPPVGIIYGDIGPLGRGISCAGNDLGELLRRDAHPVVRDQKDNVLILHPAGEDNGAGFAVFFQDAVKDGIFNDRLQGELGDLIFHQLVRDIRHKGDAVVIAHILQADIDGDMLFLLGDGADALFAAQGQLIKPGKILYGAAYLVCASLLGKPVDHIHGIIEKVGIDLCLQRIEFRDAQLLGGSCLILDQPAHLPCHIVIGIDQVADLIVGDRTFHGNRRTLADLLHLADDRRDPVGDGMGKDIGKNNSQDQKGNIPENILHHKIIALLDQRPGRKDGDHEPSGLADPVKAGVYFFVQNTPFDKIVGGHDGFLNRFIADPVNTGKGTVRGGNQRIPVIYDIGNASLQTQVFRQDRVDLIGGIVDRRIAGQRSSLMIKRDRPYIGHIPVFLLLDRAKIKGRAVELLDIGISLENTVPVGTPGLAHGSEDLLCGGIGKKRVIFTGKIQIDPYGSDELPVRQDVYLLFEFFGQGGRRQGGKGVVHRHME